ncbi:anti-sigma B factor antagonist [Bacillus mesophilus]|uniref:anti-sigma factor antagonist n=1 Tax=Bacillus mesophilus TaxID=1808955 RepID=UPI00195AD6E4|nr:anti-sigma B factor antagonist [Bacillus mesophilus]
MNLQVEINQEGLTHHVFVKGEVDAYTAPQLKDQLVPLAEQKDANLSIDLAGVSYIDSTGLGVFIGVLKTTRKSGGSLQLIGLNERVKRLFMITGLHEIINISGGE